jgi:hypothetical protein
MKASFVLTALAGVVAAQSDIPISKPLQAILAQAGTGKYTYPTSLTQGIIPKAIHSHNDYWRPVPFYSALSVGAISVEADVWLYNETLYVGHEQSALTTARTLDSLYIQPILNVIRAENPNSTFAPVNSKNGVFDTSSGQTLYLWIDLKTDGAKTMPYVVKALQPLRDAGYLTTYDGKTVTKGPVTVIGTGNTPRNLVQGVAPRDYFWDAQIATLNSTENLNITSDVSPIASGTFNGIFGEVRNRTLNSTQLRTLESQVQVAHARGLGVRYWDTPGWPIGTRNAVWRTLWDNGVTLVNVDDVVAAANFWENDG